MQNLKILLSVVALSLLCPVTVGAMESEQKKMSEEDKNRNDNAHKMWLMTQHMKNEDKYDFDARGKIGQELHSVSGIKFRCPLAMEVEHHRPSIGYGEVALNINSIDYFIQFSQVVREYGSKIAVDINRDGEVEDIICGIGIVKDYNAGLGIYAHVDFKAMGVNPKDVKIGSLKGIEGIPYVAAGFGTKRYIVPSTFEITIYKR